ncbi:TPA: hypothetical protein DF272_02285 [Candidatus Falkowbacteria bacterium]|nr:hypothetical protein [Candidatus Falkowbacteria bacterium]
MTLGQLRRFITGILEKENQYPPAQFQQFLLFRDELMMALENDLGIVKRPGESFDSYYHKLDRYSSSWSLGYSTSQVVRKMSVLMDVPGPAG